VLYQNYAWNCSTCLSQALLDRYSIFSLKTEVGHYKLSTSERVRKTQTKNAIQ